MQKPCLCLMKSFSRLGTELTLISGILAFICWDSPHVKPLSLYRDMLSLGEQAVMFDAISFSTAGKARGRLIKQANGQGILMACYWDIFSMVQKEQGAGTLLQGDILSPQASFICLSAFQIQEYNTQQFLYLRRPKKVLLFTSVSKHDA